MVEMADGSAPFRITGETGDWEVVVGLEVHAQITASKAKLFSGAATAFGAEPNTQVSLVDAAMPGMLPVPNRECIRQAVRTGLALDAAINRWSRFDRKNYFYADLPQGYQISQLYHPLVGEGSLHIEADDKAGIAADKVIGIERIHVEQDAGKLMHDQHPTMSYVDLNRSGVALMEIVSRPDMRSPAEAGAYVRKLRSILRYVGSCDGNMEEGSMRADVNVSVRKPGEPFGTRTETKNVNSVRFVMQTIEHEARRQVELIEEGGTVVQETRLFDPNTGTTRSMRSKEDAHDYRYFPDPDLCPVVTPPAEVELVRSSLTELPRNIRQRLEQAWAITPYDSDVIVAQGRPMVDYFEAVAKLGGDGKKAANWVTQEVQRTLNEQGWTLAQFPLSAAALGELVKLVVAGEIEVTRAKEVFNDMVANKRTAAQSMQALGIGKVDLSELEAICQELVAANPKIVADVKSGKQQAVGALLGQAKKRNPNANPNDVRRICLELIAKM